MSDKPSRRDIMRPVQLLGLAFGAAVFAGVVTLISMGAFQARGGDQVPRAIVVALVVSGITFIVTLVGTALMILAVDPRDIDKRVDRPVLLPPEDEGGIDESSGDEGSAGDEREGSGGANRS